MSAHQENVRNTSLRHSQALANHNTESQTHSKCNVALAYSFLLGGLVITILTTWVLLQVELIARLVGEHPTVVVLLTGLLMTVITSIFSSMNYKTEVVPKLLCWAGLCVLTALPLVGTSSSVLTYGMLYTVLLVTLLFIKSFLVPQRIVQQYLPPLCTLHTLVLVCSIYCVLVPKLPLPLFITVPVSSMALHGGIFVYSALLLCNTQRVCLNAHNHKFDPLFTAFVIYMNIINLFTRIIVFSSLRTQLAPKVCKEV